MSYARMVALYMKKTSVDKFCRQSVVRPDRGPNCLTH